MEDVLALYERPLLEREPMVCMDEKPIVLHADLRPAFPMRPGRIARRDCEYKRLKEKAYTYGLVASQSRRTATN